MQNKYLIEPSTVEVLRSKYILLDTNFLIDAGNFKEEAADLILQLKELECYLLTTQAVVLETLGGITSIEDSEKRVAYLELVFGRSLDQIVPLPIERQLPAREDILTFSRQCQKFDATDFELYRTLKKYKQSGLLLITRNHSDFTNKICNRIGLINLLGNKEIRSYGVYQSL